MLLVRVVRFVALLGLSAWLVAVGANARAQDDNPEDGLDEEVEDTEAEEGSEEGDAAASAEPPPVVAPPIGGRVRLGLELSVIEYESLSLEVDDGSMTSYDRATGSVGLTGGAAFGAVVGYGLSENLLLNASVIVSHSSESFGNESFNAFRLEVLPAAEYVFGEGKDVRPFLGGALGLRIRNAPVAAAKFEEVSLVPAAQAGVHVFMADAVSFDARLLLGYLFSLSATSTGARGPLEYNANGLVALVAGGMSYWL